MHLTKGKRGFGIFSAALACFVVGGALFALGYWQGQRSMQPQLKTLADEVASSHPQPPANPWPAANAMRPPMPQAGTNLPANATPEMREFMQNRQTLTQKMAELRQQNPGTNGAPDPKLFAEFQQENATLLQRQKELSQIISQQQARNPIPAPPPLQIPPNASPQLQAYLTDRDHLMRDQIAFMNKHRTDDPATRQSAMQQWRQQNAARFQQLQQEAQDVAQTTSRTSTTPITPTSTNP